VSFSEKRSAVAALIRRFLRSGSPTSVAARRWLSVGLIPVAALFVSVGFWRTWTTAYLLLSGEMEPSKAHAGVVAVLLSVGGYLLVPFVIGTAVAGYFTRTVELTVESDPEAKVAGLVGKRKKKVPAGSPHQGSGDLTTAPVSEASEGSTK
jgi:hypothetical protein